MKNREREREREKKNKTKKVNGIGVLHEDFKVPVIVSGTNEYTLLSRYFFFVSKPRRVKKKKDMNLVQFSKDIYNLSGET